MDIGIARERCAGERRAIILPQDVKRLVEAGHRVFVEKGLGQGVYVNDAAYRQAGAGVIAGRKDIFNKSLVVKLKAPTMQEFKLLQNNLLFCMLHAGQNPRYIKALKERNVRAVAMEMILDNKRERLIQCSDMTGEQGMIYAFHLADKSPCDCAVLVLGYGAVAGGALAVAFSLGAKVKILRKREYPYIEQFIKDKDIVVNAIKWPRDKREKREYLIAGQMLTHLNKGAVVLDLSVDYPSPIEGCRPSSVQEPVYTVDGVKYISIYGYPALVPISSSQRYSSRILPILLKIASTPLNKLPKFIRNAVVCPRKGKV